MTPAQKLTWRYQQFGPSNAIDLNALGSGSNKLGAVLDNSSQLGGVTAIIRKITVQLMFDPEDTFDKRLLLLGIVRLKEGSNAIALDDRPTVRDLKTQKQIFRGPWQVHTPTTANSITPYDMSLKTLVLKNVAIDDNDDIQLAVTNMGSAFSASTQVVKYFTRLYYRVIS